MIDGDSLTEGEKLAPADTLTETLVDPDVIEVGETVTV